MSTGTRGNVKHLRTSRTRLRHAVLWSVVSAVALVMSACTPTTTTPTNSRPTAVATSNVASGLAPLTVSFDGTGSHDSDGTISSYSWKWGDGSPNGSGATWSHSCSNATRAAI